MRTFEWTDRGEQHETPFVGKPGPWPSAKATSLNVDISFYGGNNGKFHGIVSLKSEVKRHAREGAECRKRILETNGDDCHDLWNASRSIGHDNRSFLLAYGFLRGVLYEAMERKCATSPNGPAILLLCRKYGGEEWTQQHVSSLLTRPVPEQEAA